MWKVSELPLGRTEVEARPSRDDATDAVTERAMAAWRSAEIRLRAMRADHPARQALEVAVTELRDAARRESDRPHRR